MIDKSIYYSITEGMPLSATDYPKTSVILPSFIEAVKAKDKRGELESEVKKDRKNMYKLEIDRVACCLTILSNINAHTKDIMYALYDNYIDEDDKKDDKKQKPFIDRINTNRNYLKEIKVFNKSRTQDDLCYSFIHAYAKFNNNGDIVSLDDKAISFYKDVISYWNNGNWDNTYNEYFKASSKPNDIRFIACFCKDKNYSRATAQRYLIIFNREDCFTNNDLQTITGGRINLFDILNKIGFLTKK